MFKFSGQLPSSKSLVNRALIIQSYQSQVEVAFATESVDVQVLQKALLDLKKGGKIFHCADAGTTFRFLVLRLSREPGQWIIKGSRRLLSRPHTALVQTLSAFGVDVEVSADQWIVYSKGWKNQPVVTVSTEQSSQFASSVLLNSWGLPFDLEVRLSETQVSLGYLQMTLELMKKFGFRYESSPQGFRIPANQTPAAIHYLAEQDVSSCFALAACAVQNGDVRIQNFPFDSLQPDVAFFQILKNMGAHAQQDKTDLVIQKTLALKAVKVSLKNTPDLFPVLAVLCARAQGTSELSDLLHLSVKESDRLQNTMHLLERLGCNLTLNGTTLHIEGNLQTFSGTGVFDPDQDHRMAMAAHVANLYGARFQILDPHVVEKSYPQFWQHAGEASLC
jgi:3-phosphoshikimate 1-carboxyvinyltransferase